MVKLLYIFLFLTRDVWLFVFIQLYSYTLLISTKFGFGTSVPLPCIACRATQPPWWHRICRTSSGTSFAPSSCRTCPCAASSHILVPCLCIFLIPHRPRLWDLVWHGRRSNLRLRRSCRTNTWHLSQPPQGAPLCRFYRLRNLSPRMHSPAEASGIPSRPH